VIYKKILYGKVASVYKWFSTIKWILTHRGNDSYGRIELVNALLFFKAIRKASFENLILAEEFVGMLLQDFWPKISPFQLLRRGPQFDSGYMIAELNKFDNVVSGGAGKNIDFEMSFALEGSAVNICDPFVYELPVIHENIRHYKILLNYFEPSKKGEYLTLGEFEELIGLRSEEINLLKLDIEGSEVNLLGQVGIDLNKYDQIVIELHNLHRITEKQFREQFELLKTNLLKNHHVIFFNGNNNGLLLNFGPYLIPEVFELTLLHKKYFTDLTKQKYQSTKILQDVINNPQRGPLLNIYSYLSKISEEN
jgi:hypothetical protein